MCHGPSPAPEYTVSETGVSWPGLATEPDESETGVLSPGPSTKPIHPRSPTRDSWNNSWDRYDKWTDVWKSGHGGNRWIHGWNEHYHDDNWTDAWRATRPMLGANVNLMMSGVPVTGKRAAEARATGRRADGTTQTSAVMIARDSSGQVIPSSRQ